MDENESNLSQHNVVCEQCGGVDFRLQDGYYYCTECQLQTQDYQQHVMEGEYGGATTRVKKVKDHNSEAEKSQTDQPSVRGSSAVSSWEILNYVLKGLVDELILLGAPKSLKPITLQLWASYLSKTEIAFTSTKVQAKPKFGIYHRRHDPSYFYKTTTSSVKLIPKLLRRTKKRSKIGGRTTELAKRRRLQKEKRDLARDVYNNESVASSSVADSQSSFNLSSLNSSLASLGSQQTKLSKSERFSYSHKGKSEVEEFLSCLTGNENPLEYHRKCMIKLKHTVNHATLLKVITLLRIALLICGSNIHIGDMRRWMEEGYLSLDCSHKFIPPNVHLSKLQILLLSQVPFYNHVSIQTKEIVKLLSISDDSLSPANLINALVKRYCAMLNLPDAICVGVERLLEMKPVQTPLSRVQEANFEARAMAYILFSLKVLIGLDDATEYSYVPRSGTEGLTWEEWCQQYVARMAEKALTHHPTLCRLYPNSYIGRDHSLLSNWDLATEKSDPFRSSCNDVMPDPVMKDSIRQVLTPLLCQLPEPSWKPGLAADETRTGPPLLVLSERVDSSAEKIQESVDDNVRNAKKKKRKKSIVLVQTFKAKKLNFDSSERVRVQLEDGEHEEEPSWLETVTLYPLEPIKNPTDQQTMSTTNELPAAEIWMYHSSLVGSTCRPKDFDRTIQEKLPFSFVWLLGEMASMIYQPKKSIYKHLMKIEASFKSPKSRKSKDLRLYDSATVISQIYHI